MPRKAPQDKPLASLRTFARQLGWLHLRWYQHQLEPNEFVTWYESGKSEGSRNDLFLQINECPIGQTTTYAAAVYAFRYRICTGWHSMTLWPDAGRIRCETERLQPWLHRSWFQSLANRRQFRQMHPECCEWSWKRIKRFDRLPYEVVDAARGITARSLK